jgi:hypothetical protein
MHAHGALASPGSDGRTHWNATSPVDSLSTNVLQSRNHSMDRQTGQRTAESDSPGRAMVDVVAGRLSPDGWIHTAYEHRGPRIEIGPEPVSSAIER